MKLREHPLMSYRGVATWPPAWTPLHSEIPAPVGEIGILEDATMNGALGNKVFMTILHEGRRFMGCLMFQDPAFCSEVFALLKLHRGNRIQNIGDMDVASTL